MAVGSITVDLDTLQGILNKLNDVVTQVGVISNDLIYVNANLAEAVSGTGTVATTISNFDGNLNNALSTFNSLSTTTLQPMINSLQKVWNDANDAANTQL